tara:strand:- start:357 stop:1124 length:768 start_codon:yes stop_codon:yes gene_type:complete
MSFQNLTPLSKTALLYNQLGSTFVTINNLDVAGSDGGHNGVGTQSYVELLAGKECYHSHWHNSDGTLGSLEISSIATGGGVWVVTPTESVLAEVGALVKISGTTNYNGKYKISAVHPAGISFKIANTASHSTETSGTIESANHFNAEDNTTGTKYYPDIAYFTGIKNYGAVFHAFTGAFTNIIEGEITAQSVDGDDLARPDVLGTYNPDNTVSNYMFLFHGDEIFGKFNRIAMYKTPTTGYKSRLRALKGPSYLN